MNFNGQFSATKLTLFLKSRIKFLHSWCRAELLSCEAGKLLFLSNGKNNRRLMVLASQCIRMLLSYSVDNKISQECIWGRYRKWNVDNTKRVQRAVLYWSTNSRLWSESCTYLVQILTKIFRRSSNKINKEYNITTFVSEISRNKASIVGRGILVRWLLYRNSKWTRK